MEKTKGTIKVVEVDKINPGPIRKETLPDNLYNRLKKIFEATFEVQSMTFKKFEEGFRRDINPLSEIIIWERIAKVYVQFIIDHHFSLEKKEAVLFFLIFLSATSTPFDLSDDNNLTAIEKKHLVDLYLNI